MSADSAAAPSTLAPPPPAHADDVVLLARQPIVDSTSAVRGHELLFRREDGSGWPIGDEARATAHVVVSAFADLSLRAVTGECRAWVNVPRAFLLETDIGVLPPDRVVIELLERDHVDEEYVDKARALAEAGYEIALDDFTFREEWVPLLDIATYVKLDLRELGVGGVARHMDLLAPYDVRVVAEKVETAAERDGCLALGIDLFQGHFIERPRLVRGRPAPHGTMQRLRTATNLGSEAAFEDVERVVKQDPGLSVRLLRYINSAALALRQRVSSLRQALLLVGADTVRQWILLVLMGDLGRAKPAVLSAGLVRARLCETLARRRGVRAADSAFIVGLLSICDALLDAPLDEIIGGLPLTPEVAAAIVHREGPLGELLAAAVALHRGELPPGGHDGDALLDAVKWADVQLAEFTAACA